ncbi:helix-turn-helix domain-containing protein [Pararhizobium sp. O133]|uniref:helix-turn-helix domain-containing protein n=1 Tax=Pararhizobium sp. O133 TaxID=3449278 RepID=UPI003F686E25
MMDTSGKKNETGNGLVRVRDFMGNDDIAFDSPDDHLSMDDTLMKGTFLHRELRRGLVLHASDAIEERAFKATTFLPEELSCIFFLEGDIDLGIGDRRFSFRAHAGDACGVSIMNASPENFERVSHGRQRLRHLVVSASPEWLHTDLMETIGGTDAAKRLLDQHLAEHRWSLSPRVLDVIRQIFSPSPLVPALHGLYLEGRAVELVAESISAMLHVDRHDDRSTLRRKDIAHLEQAKAFINANAAESLSVEIIALQAGISATGLQRLFRASEGRSVFDYVRIVRLERAFAALQKEDATVQEASAIAGYTSAANFATAFRRQFGKVPTAVRTRQ